MMLGSGLIVPYVSQKLGRVLRTLSKGWENMKRLEKKSHCYQVLK